MVESELQAQLSYPREAGGGCGGRLGTLYNLTLREGWEGGEEREGEVKEERRRESTEGRRGQEEREGGRVSEEFGEPAGLL